MADTAALVVAVLILFGPEAVLVTGFLRRRHRHRALRARIKLYTM